MQETFVKTAPKAELARFETEAAGLKALRAAGCVRVPEVIRCALVGSDVVIELERLELCGLNRVSGALLGRQLADLHRHVGECYGWPEDNWIGDSPQLNGLRAEWTRFYAERRLVPQLKWATTNGMDRVHVDRGISLADRVGGFFVDYHPQPSLLHGDLWSGNASALPDGTPVIFDPAVYYGDREADLAMSELFGGFPESFYAAYRTAWPLDSGYETRKTLYNLYHVLNHFNLFGAGYLNQATRMIDRLLAELRG
jgi:fructosamine-3-kinase